MTRSVTTSVSEGTESPIERRGDRISICFVSLNATKLFSPHAARESIGGAEVQQYLLAIEFARRGVRTSFVVAPDSGLGLNHAGIEVIGACSPSEGWPGIRLVYPQLWKLWRAMRTADAGVYYARGAKFESFLVWLFCRIKGRKLIQAIAHDNDCAWETLVSLKRDIKRCAYLTALKRADIVLAQSDKQRQLLAENFEVASMLVNNVVSLPADAKDAPSVSCKRFLWIGTLKPSKRPDMLLELAEQYPEISFVMIGPTPSRYADFGRRIHVLAGELNNVEMRGYVPYDQVHAEIEAADAVMLTSDSEGFPNVILQAWAARRPVLSCYDPDSLLSRDGLGVYAQDRESLASAVEYFSDERSNSARVNMVAKAYEYVSSHHSTAVIGEQILGLMASQAVAAPLIPSR